MLLDTACTASTLAVSYECPQLLNHVHPPVRRRLLQVRRQHRRTGIPTRSQDLARAVPQLCQIRSLHGQMWARRPGAGQLVQVALILLNMRDGQAGSRTTMVRRWRSSGALERVGPSGYLEGLLDNVDPDSTRGTLPIRGSPARINSQARSAADSKSGASAGSTCQPVTGFPST